jgi:hypothetical protein
MDGSDCSRCQAIAKPEHAEQAKATEPWPHKTEPEPSATVFGCSSCFGVAVVVILVAYLLMPSVSRVRPAHARVTAMHNMKQIALACHNYHDFHKTLPTPSMVVAKDGKEHSVALSWRVSILPHIEQEMLHKRLDLTVGWDQGRNVAFQDQMPMLYQCPYRSETEPHRTTHFQYFTGPQTLFAGNAPRTLKEITDGAERTILFAEAADPVVWSRPADMAIRPDEELPLPADRFLAAMADGRVRMIYRKTIDDAILRQLINPNDNLPAAGWDN